MQVPGTETRKREDRKCDVNCTCGAILITLRAGQRIALKRTGASMDVTCKSCGKTSKVKVEDVNE